MKRALTIAGSDSGGGAGIQADLKTFTALGVYGTSALTAVTAQNTTGVQGVWPLDPGAVRDQLDAVLSDIGTDSAKTGMLFSAPIIEVVADRLRAFGVSQLVVDPVMIAKGGAALLQAEATEVLKRDLIPLALVATPNLPEAEALTGMTVTDRAGMRRAGEAILGLGARAVVVKGGHLEGEEAVDLFLTPDGEPVWLPAPRLATRHTHGTGCTFSAAIAAGLAQGLELLDAVRQAKRFITDAIRTAPGLGAGHGPTNHLCWQKEGC
jgi:hydroxymethylpyrimidine/phosphomethylpyrimidine kinase